MAVAEYLERKSAREQMKNDAQKAAQKRAVEIKKASLGYDSTNTAEEEKSSLRYSPQVIEAMTQWEYS